MEIIPILAFIILVATIATFIFATAAYILYKIKESKGKIVHSQPSQAFHAEFVTPEPMETNTTDQPGFQASFHHAPGSASAGSNTQNTTSANQQEPRFMRYTPSGNVPVTTNANGRSKQWQ